MRIWIRPEDILHLASIVSPHIFDTDTLKVLHLSFIMGYVDSAPYFVAW